MRRSYGHASGVVELREHFATACERLAVPGAALGVITADGEQFDAYGVTSAEHRWAMSEDCVIRIASMTKMLTATMAIRLVHFGEIDLDAPIRQYVPELRLADADVASRITMRHLLSHTGGWLDDPLMEVPSGADVFEFLASLPQLTPLGSTWSYSTTGFFIAGVAIEAVTSMSYAEALAELVTRPLGMTRTGVSTEHAITFPVAMGHEERGHQSEVVRPWPAPSWDVAAQGAYSTVRDLARFARFHLTGADREGRELVDPALLAAMREPQVADGSRGLGWVLREVYGTVLPNHPGGLYGYASDLLLDPSQQFGIIVAANVSSHALDREVLAFAIERCLGLTDREISLRSLTGVALDEYAGRYAGISRDLDVAVDGEHLVVQVVREPGRSADGVERASRPRPIRIALYDGDRVVVLDGPLKGDARGEFVRDESGQVAFFRFPTFMHVRQPRQTLRPTPSS